jgi:hypothetical protein
MRRLPLLALLALCALLLAAPRWSSEKKVTGRFRITLYRVAPGKHVDFLKWMAAQDEVAREAGVPVVQLYAHIDGDSWDYLGIAPVTTPEQDSRLDELAAAKGLKTGMPASIQFRDLLSWHTDTLAAGPVAAKELLAQATK